MISPWICHLPIFRIRLCDPRKPPGAGAALPAGLRSGAHQRGGRADPARHRSKVWGHEHPGEDGRRMATATDFSASESDIYRHFIYILHGNFYVKTCQIFPKRWVPDGPCFRFSPGPPPNSILGGSAAVLREVCFAIHPGPARGSRGLHERSWKVLDSPSERWDLLQVIPLTIIPSR